MLVLLRSIFRQAANVMSISLYDYVTKNSGRKWNDIVYCSVLIYETAYSNSHLTKMSSKKRNFKSKESTITCHVCKKVMLEQNFSTHMRNLHKSNETRDASQMSIAAMLTPEKRPRMEQESSAYSVADINGFTHELVMSR